MTITLNWDPQEGMALPEGKVVEWVDKVLSGWEATGRKPLSLSVGQDLIINEFRLAVSRKRIDCSEISILVDDERIVVHESGRLHNWPKGFCDLMSNQLCSLVGWNRNNKDAEPKTNNN